jgi:hypothetical protein
MAASSSKAADRTPPVLLAMKAGFGSVHAMNGTKTHPRPRERVAFAQRLRQARIAAGHATMEAAARAIGIRSSVYWRHENGKQGITLDFVRLYARAFAVDPGWLAFGNRRRLT